MDEESLEEQSVEVLGIPADVDDDLLCLYFENARRSGGGSVISLDRNDDRAVVVFEEAEVAARVLARDKHILNSATMTVRKKTPSDQRRLLLRGLNPKTSLELVELYVENITGIESDDYTLYQSPARDLVVIHLHKPFTPDFKKLREKISKRPLDGARIVLERLERTDTILVENLGPNVAEDVLTLYFEGSRGGEGEVMEVKMMAEGTAKVTFKDFDSVERALQKPHKLDGIELTVKPYLPILQAEGNMSLTVMQNGNTETEASGSDQQQMDTSDLMLIDRPGAEPMDVSPADINNRVTQTASSRPEPSTAVSAASVAMATAGAGVGEEAMAKPTSSSVSVPDPVKLDLLGLSSLPQDLQKAHPKCVITKTQDGVHIAGPDPLVVEKIRYKVLEFLGGIAQVHFTFESEKAKFLEGKQVKDKLLSTLKNQGIPSAYAVSDCVVVVTSLSVSMVNQACDFIKSQISQFNMPVNRDNEGMLYTREWSDFLQSLAFCSARVTDGGPTITVVTLKGMEEEMKSKITHFLTTPVQKETVLSMEPGMLKYLQLHHQELLAVMDQVIIFPLESGDGLSIQGNVSACQMAEEVLNATIGATCTKALTVSQPGIARFLVEDEGTSILQEMTTKFQVYINLEKVHWEPLEDKDVFDLAWEMTSCQNFQRHASAQALTATDPNANNPGATNRQTTAQIEAAKKLLFAIESDPQPLTDMEEDLYTDENQSADNSVTEVTDPSQAGMKEDDLYLSLDEDARLSLAIQLSMESSQGLESEYELQKVLEMSMNAGATPSAAAADSQLEKAVEASLQDAIKSANTAEIYVYAAYTHDLIRVDIALGKKVGSRQCEEKVEHKILKNLSAHQRRCLELIKRKHAVEIQVQGTTATVSGFKDYVAGAVPELKNLLKRTANTVSDADILKTVQWVYQVPGSTVVTPYPPEATVFIENAWKMRQKKIDILFDNQPHSIDFGKMLEHSIGSGKSVPIARKILNAEELCNDGADEEECSLLSNMPEATRVLESSDEFQEVVKEFYDSIQEHHNRIRIVKVEKLMNRLLYNQYKLKKSSMMQNSTTSEVERTLYHGTNETSVKEICIHGFNRSFCGKNATVYGQGVYFAVNSALSVSDTYSPPNADGHKFVFVARVLTGDFTVGKHEMKTAPLKDSSNIPLRYDSVVDKTSSPTLFVIFNDTQAYPQYLITCQKIHR
ncbi:protein mono-ADP-ribosyltransferase PARP10 [Chanos chanos]|uniref:Poly [ADP-ribose] polymerase n=1 Tax=Chanos chanos TaxID=29144 RepID=A0A6J2WL95_CHACN|nr:protein mono-ADP-ribosyltransferase PARP10 [Chanos chanos]